MRGAPANANSPTVVQCVTTHPEPVPLERARSIGFGGLTADLPPPAPTLPLVSFVLQAHEFPAFIEPAFAR